MRNLFATLYFLLSLIGCDGGATTFATRATVDGEDIVYGKARVQSGIVHFECVRSASGQCHYTVFPRECTSVDPSPASRPPACAPLPAERFALPAGTSRDVVGMTAAFELCVSHDARVMTIGCKEATVAHAAARASTADG
ncbi:hypothetical protein [Agrilutibacter solisilvae]|uniref:Uncharacterized protein n=1 Tax=Agrilutibacter solisilvae TaxID=2763317 RepID=A0A974XWC4_9GAMM|nr:hypothetical protein [Lysobacter solisilvae]QSX77076.1 hypothetical protein I8J32_009680 [Lysobacter solisilvae]